MFYILLCIYFVIKAYFLKCAERTQFRPDSDNFPDNPGYIPKIKILLKNIISRFIFSPFCFSRVRLTIVGHILLSPEKATWKRYHMVWVLRDRN